MDMDFVGSLLQLVNLICSPISKCFKYHRGLNKSMARLKIKLEELNSPKGDNESRMRTELLLGKKPKEEVQLWLENVERINGKAQAIEQQVQNVKFLSRAGLGKQVSKLIQEVEGLHQKGSFPDGLVVDAPEHYGEKLPIPTIVGEATAKTKMEEIWAYLISDDVRKIGVYGMGGCGETTIMKQINNRLLEETDKFDNVIWVTVSKPFNLVKLQNDIAQALGLELSTYEDETKRAAKLSEKLCSMKRYVLILDDMWERFQLEDVGIPEPTLGNGCKLVLTTRSLEVCRHMGCKNIIKMELLTEEEAWNLFLDTDGLDDVTPNLEKDMKLVADECARLPLAIIMIAGSMQGIVDTREWRNAYEEWNASTNGLGDMRSKVLDRLKFSYSHLKDEKLQQCLLYCALYPEDFKINRKELIECMIDEGIIREMKSRQAEFDKGHSMLNKLENVCLLESTTGYDNDICVKMHDLIRDMALQIMSTSPCFLVEAGVQLRGYRTRKNGQRI